MAAGMEHGGINAYDSNLDTELQYVATNYYGREGGAPNDPCGLAATDYTGTSTTNKNYGRPFWRRANSCMDDHALNAQGYAWVAAWQRLSGRSYQTRRLDAISSIRKALRTYDSICVHNRPQYESESNNRTIEANPCNAQISQLGQPGVEIVSLNHGNQAPNGLEVNPRGQGPRGYGSAARRMPHLKRAMQAARRRARCAERAGSAGGPKPGRAGFYLELGRP